MSLNPVERCLVALCNHWEKFRTDSSKRLLVWMVPDNAIRLLQCFFEVQKHETEYTTKGLFIVFDVPFENSIQYSRDLKEALAGQYDASIEDLKKQGITPDWQFVSEEFPDTAAGFVQSLCSFAVKYQEIIGQLVAVLMPAIVANDNAFVSWLLYALDAGIPEQVRLAAIDSVEAPRLKQLVTSGHKLIHVDRPNIDALVTAQETFAQEAAVGPAAVFRNQLMGIMTLVEKGSSEQVKAKAADALEFARKQNWADQQVVVIMLVAGALLKEKRCDEAAMQYQGARQIALQAKDAGHPAGQDLVLQTWFGEASTYLAAGNYAPASECYDRAADVAQAIPNLILAIEAFRMGAFCQARLNNRDAAIEAGSSAMTLGEKLKPDERAMTTLPIAAVDLLRTVEPKRVERMEDIKHRKDEQQEKALQVAEQRVASLKEANQQQLGEIEHCLETDSRHAEQAAAQDLEAVAAGGCDQFRQFFTIARNLLGTQWPLTGDIAIPRMPTTKGVTAS